jgi:hypothetical protein
MSADTSAEAVARIAEEWQDLGDEIGAATLRALLAERDALKAEVEDWKMSFIAFAGPAAAQHARDSGLPDGHLHPHHFDMLEKAGARMDSFTRARGEAQR